MLRCRELITVFIAWSNAVNDLRANRKSSSDNQKLRCSMIYAITHGMRYGAQLFPDENLTSLRLDCNIQII